MLEKMIAPGRGHFWPRDTVGRIYEGVTKHWYT